MTGHGSLDVERYRREGACWPVGTVDVGGLEEHFFEIQRASMARRGRELHISPHLVSTRIDALANDPIILDPVEQVLGTDFVLWESDFARKAPGASGYIPWHADGPYWNLSTNEVVTAWVALTEVTEANAAMQVVPRSHLRPDAARLDYDGDPMSGYLNGVRTSSRGNVFAYDTVVADDIDPDRDAISVELAPGEFSLHHVDLLHGGGPNRSRTERIGIAFRYMSTRTHCRTGLDSVSPVRGSIENPMLVIEPRPTRSLSAAAWEAHDEAMQYPSGFGDRTMTARDG